MIAPAPTMRGQVRVANVYREGHHQPLWHLSRYDAIKASQHVEQHTRHRLAYRVVARFK